MTHASPEIGWPEANARRMTRQGLTEPLSGGIPDIVAAMAGAHAQVMPAAELAIGLRMTGITRSAVQKALWEDRVLIKTYGPRGTVHLLPARDLSRWIGALGAVPTKNPMSRDARLTIDQTDEVVTAIGEILLDDELTIDELDLRIVEATGSWAGDRVMPAFGGYWPRWRQVIGTAANRGVLCFGPNRGRKVTYTAPQRLLPGFTLTDPDEALTWLLTQYLQAYGPATPASFAKWLAVPVGWANELFASRRDQIERVALAGSEAWVVANDAMFPSEEATGVRLLPYFDPFAVASHPRERLYRGAAADRALARGQAGNYPVLLVDGVVNGVWHQRRSGKRIDITVEPLTELTSSQRAALDVEVERVAAILEGRPHLTIGPISVGPHA